MVTFLQAFSRFSSRKSLSKYLISDNASTYLYAAEELQQLFNSPENLHRRGVMWKFIPKYAKGILEKVNKTAVKNVNLPPCNPYNTP